MGVWAWKGGPASKWYQGQEVIDQSRWALSVVSPSHQDPGPHRCRAPVQLLIQDWQSSRDTGDALVKWLFNLAAAAAKLLQSCPTLCDPIDGSPPGSAIPGILQARTLEWVAISFSNAWKWKVKVKSLSRVWLLATPWTATYQAPPSMGFSRQEYWSGVPLPSPCGLHGTVTMKILIIKDYKCKKSFLLIG